MGHEQRRALQIVSGLLQAIVKRAESFNELDRWTIRHDDGELIAECTIAEALDMADLALEQSQSDPGSGPARPEACPASAEPDNGAAGYLVPPGRAEDFQRRT